MSEEFYGVTLSGANTSVVWDPVDKEDLRTNKKLIIKQILLGVDAQDGEYNVIQAETMSFRNTVKIPIAVLKVGECRQARLDLDFPDPPVTFKLIKGTGPVHIHGQDISVEEYEDLSDMDEMEAYLDEEEGEEDEDEEGHQKKKQKISNNTKGKAPIKTNKKK